MGLNRTDIAAEKLERFLLKRGERRELTGLSPDASTREYFRISNGGEARIACVYPEPVDRDLPALDTSALFLAAALPVAKILEVDEEEGIVIQEDLGDTLLREFLESAGPETRDLMFGKAIRLIAGIQNATVLAQERNSVASRLKFDRDKFLWELDFFIEHYFNSLKRQPLSQTLETGLRREFGVLSEELEAFSRVLTHRDFHVANLMVSGGGDLFIIDHQDARIGSAAYDLVSLLLDRITIAPEDEWLAEKRALLLEERAKLGLEPIDPEKFAYEFDLVSIQRCLKAIGTFSTQAGNFGRRDYTEFISPMFGVVYATCRRLKRFPALAEVIIGERTF